MSECVANGIRIGWSKAHKYHENPTPGQIQQAVEMAVLNEIAEYFIFEDNEPGE